MSAWRSDGNLETSAAEPSAICSPGLEPFMTPQETSLVTALLERLKTTDGQIKDPEAEMLIRQTTAEQADATYYLAQTVLIQDLSLHCAQSRIAELERNLADAKTAAAPPPSFLHGLLETNPPPTRAPSAPLPTAQDVTPVPPASATGWLGGMGGGGFLRSAAVTAAGVAGGALLFEGIQSMFGRHDAAGIIGNQAAASDLGDPTPRSGSVHTDADSERGADPAYSVDQDYGSGHDLGGVA